MPSPASTLAAALVLGAGIALAGGLVGDGFRRARLEDRVVTVKGLAERTVRADLALWPLRFVATGDDLAAVQAKIRADADAVRRFLAERGVAAEQTELQNLDVTDRLAQAYRSGPVDSRFIVAQTILVRSTEVETLARAAQDTGALVDAGVVLSNEMGQGSPYYLFTRLNDLKPEMIGEATRNARAAAEQFAADSESRLGGIRRASQGVFEILPRDKAPNTSEERQIEKTVRVVSTLEYRLED